MALVIMGLMGTGKSTICFFLSLLVGEDEEQYYTKFQNINDITSRFNADMMTTIITAIEELPIQSGSYHSVHSQLKTLITDRCMSFEKKGVDKFKGKSNNNFVLMTNEINPVPVNKENRRFIILKISDAEKGQRQLYFTPLRKEIIEKIEEIRYYFNTFEFIDDINSIRPITDIEQDLYKLNENITDRYIEEVLELNEEDEFSDDNNFSNIYNDYKWFCHSEGRKTIRKAYFSVALRKYGYTTKYKKIDGIKQIFVCKNLT